MHLHWPPEHHHAAVLKLAVPTKALGDVFVQVPLGRTGTVCGNGGGARLVVEHRDATNLWPHAAEIADNPG